MHYILLSCFLKFQSAIQLQKQLLQAKNKNRFAYTKIKLPFVGHWLENFSLRFLTCLYLLCFIRLIVFLASIGLYRIYYRVYTTLRSNMRKIIHSYMLKVIVLLLQISTSSVILLCGCAKNDANVTNAINPVHAQVKSVIKKSVPVYINSFGILAAFENVDIKAQISGQISKIHFTEGAYIKKGELLFSIDPEIFHANLANDIATLEYDKADLELRKYLVEKKKSIVLNGIIPKQNYKRMLTDLAAAKAKIKVDEARIQRDKINLKYCAICSPVNGVIGIKKIDTGNIISTADILANVKSTNPLFVDFTLPEKNILRLKEKISSSETKVRVFADTLQAVRKLKLATKKQASSLICVILIT